MALGFRDWEEGRQLDIAIIAALSFAAALLLPLLGVLFFGRRRLFRLFLGIQNPTALGVIPYN